MTDVPDFRGRVQRDVPSDFLHRLMNKIPGYTGYADLERRRDADKMLRTWLGKQYRGQLTRLTRVEQDLARTGHLTALPELERLEGMLNRFIDKLETASYGYAGLFDAARVTEPELEQLYTFDQALADGVQTIAGAIDAVAAGSRPASGPAPSSPAETLPAQGDAATKLGEAI